MNTESNPLRVSKVTGRDRCRCWAGGAFKFILPRIIPPTRSGSMTSLLALHGQGEMVELEGVEESDVLPLLCFREICWAKQLAQTSADKPSVSACK